MDKRYPQNYTYMDVGHCKFDGTNCPKQLEVEEMWYVDDSYQLHTQPTDVGSVHSNSFPQFYDEVAHGRYTKDERFPNGTTIMVISGGNRMFIENPRKLDFIKKKVMQLLENNYGFQTEIYADR